MGIEDLRARLMLSLAGVLGVGCGPSLVPSDEGGATSSTGPSETSSNSNSGTGTHGMGTNTGMSTDVTSTTGDWTGSDSDSSGMLPKFDFGDTPVPAGCPPQPQPPDDACMAELPPDASFLFYCVDLAEGETCEAWARGFEETNTPLWTEQVRECLATGGSCYSRLALELGCGPLPDQGDQCCSWFIATSQQCPPEGRPFVVEGRERVAALVERDDWVGTIPLDRPPLHAAAIARTWAEHALAEHASVASFSRFILQLLACGAPATLVSAAHVALGEEIEHARLFFALASRFGGHPVGPAAVAVDGALEGSDDFDEIVLATVREGCIAETISAWHITLAATLARDPSLAASLSRVAEQEVEHAALSWRFLAWALPRASASLRRRIEATLLAPARFVPRGSTLDPQVPDAEWRAHGILSPSDHLASTQQALRELVVPISRALLWIQPPSPSAVSRTSSPACSSVS